MQAREELAGRSGTGSSRRTASLAAADTGPQAGEAVVPLPGERPVLVALSLIALGFFVLTQISIALDQTSTLLLRFDTGYEANVPTWFSSALWLAAGGLACAIGAAGRRLRDRSASLWLLLGAAFVLLAADETGQLHEEAVGPLMDAVESATGLSHASARIAAVGCVGLALAALAVWLWPWLRALPRPLLRRLTLAGTIFVGGSVALEVVSRLYETRYLSPFEELFEMLGVALLVTALLPYVKGVVARPPTASTGAR